MKINIYKTIYRSIAIALTTGTLSACDYLDVVPPETADMEDTMKDKQDALGFLYSAYSLVGQNHGVGSLGAHESSTDEFVNPLLWGRLGQVTSWNQLSSTTNSNNGLFQLPWVVTYDALGQVHLFEKILSETSPKEVTANDRARWNAEVKFLNAYYHFRLLENYGPIPIIDHYYSTSTTKEEIPGRSHFDYCVNRIVEWLDEAAAVLPATVETSELGRATSIACKALKGRVLLYAASPLWNGSFPNPNWRNSNYETPGYGTELVSTSYSREKWERARTACEDALTAALGAGNRSFYTLEASEMQRMSENVPLPDIPGTDDEFKKKVMRMRYAINAVETEGNREIVWGVISNPDSYIFWQADAYPHNILSLNGGGNGGGICAMAPLLYAVEHFYTRNGILPQDDYELPSSEWFRSAGYYGREDIINLNDKREPRFYAWLSFDGDEYSSLIRNGQPLIVDTKSSTAQGYNPEMFNRDNNVTGYYLKKWCQPNVSWNNDGSLNARQIQAPLIRLSELYLNLAECEAELEHTDAALKALNEVRRHAGIKELTTGDLSSMSLRDWVRNERFVELFAEGHRYYDTRRWMIAPNVLRGGVREGLNAIAKKDPTFEEFNQRVKVDQPFQWDDRMYLLPIPSSEIYNNPQLVQSPGY